MATQAEKFIYRPTRFMLPTSRYVKRRADRAVMFIQSLKHTKGVWAGKPFFLFPWQEQIIRDLFGIIKQNGYRQFNTAYIEIGKKNGKSELAAAVALYMLCADNEEGAEIYGCANDRAQASIVFDVARDMVMQSDLLMERIKIIESQKRLVYMPTRSIYQALSSDVASKYGYNVHACIFDELLGQPNRKLFDVMTKGSGAARKQPLNFVITTAGSDRTSICYEQHQKAQDILDGRKHDPTFYPVLYSAPEDADWTDPKVWAMANPSIGRTVDLEYRFGFAGSEWGELEGIANRTDFDLSAHAEHSGEDLSYFNQATGEKYVPYVIEPAAGLTRSLMCFLVDAYDVDEAPNTKGGVDKRTVLHLDPRLAPVKAAVLPLSKKPDLQNVAQKLAADLRQNEWMIDYDEAGAIGRRYRREDEIGTPLCVTVDFDTLDDQAVTIRERDTMQQERVSLDKVADYIAERIGEKRVSVPQMPVEMGGEAWPESVKIAEAGGLY